MAKICWGSLYSSGAIADRSAIWRTVFIRESGKLDTGERISVYITKESHDLVESVIM